MLLLARNHILNVLCALGNNKRVEEKYMYLKILNHKLKQQTVYIFYMFIAILSSKIGLRLSVFKYADLFCLTT